MVEDPFWVETNLTCTIYDGKEIFQSGIYNFFKSYQWWDDLEQGPLNRRAWVMQARFLSTRILHFASSQVFWECLENRSSEMFPIAVPKVALPFWSDDSQKLKQIFFRAQRDDKWPEKLLIQWEVFISAYSRCGLSKEDDKLVAIHGVQQLLSKATGDTLVAGLWRSKLIQELCWTRLGSDDVFRNFSPQNWRAPTWSWAAKNLNMHPGNMRYHVGCPELQTHVAIEAVDIDAFGSGQLQRASLTLRGKLLDAAFIIQGQSGRRNDTEFICGGLSRKGNSLVSDGFELTLDDCNHVLPFREELVCLAMFSCKCTRLWNKLIPTSHLFALALRPYDLEKGEYERVGLLEIQGSCSDFYVTNESNAECNLVLV